MEENEEAAPVAETKTSDNQIGLLDKAAAVAEKLEAANKRSEELINRHEAIIAKQMLAGRSEAGFKVKTALEQQEDEAQREADAIVKRFRK